jgi:5'(3')-deoxyribonucleotidase
VKKLVVFIDMDGVLADFDSQIDPIYKFKEPPQMFEKGFYRSLPVMDGAKEAIKTLLDCPYLNVYIASKPTIKNLHSTVEKYEWIQEHFPELLSKIFLTCDKRLLKGDILIDDHKRWSKFDGSFVYFKNWNQALTEVVNIVNKDKEIWFVNK